MTPHRPSPPEVIDIDHSRVAGREGTATKRAHRVAALLQQEMISGRLEAGHCLGTAAEIRARYRLGRWAFREALGILELRGVARPRPGPGGGVVVSEPGVGNLVDLTLIYLHATPHGIAELMRAEWAVLSAVVRRLLQRRNDLTSAAPPSGDWRGGLPRFLASKTGNPALALAVEFIESVRDARLCAIDGPSGDDARSARALHHAIHCGNRRGALVALDVYLDCRNLGLSEARPRLDDLSEHRASAGKSAYRLALQILTTILEYPEAWKACVGSEAEWAGRFEASGEIVRQAVRLIEDLEIVTLRRGRNGGMMVRAPDTASIASIFPHILAQRGISVADCFEATGMLNIEIARIAAGRRGGERCGVEARCSVGPINPWEMILIDRHIQARAESPLLAGIERGFLLYSCLREPPGVDERVPIDEMMRLSRAIVDAVERGDVEAAAAAAEQRFRFMALRFTAFDRYASGGAVS